MDIAISYNGNGLVSDNGDLLITTGFDDSIRRINTLVRTTISSWRVYPNFGTTMHEFVGQPNTRDTAREMSRQLEVYLNRFITDIGKLTVQAVPIDRESLNIFIFAHTDNGSIPVSRFIYSYRDGIIEKVYDPAEQETTVAKGRHSIPTNPYLRKPNL